MSILRNLLNPPGTKDPLNEENLRSCFRAAFLMPPTKEESEDAEFVREKTFGTAKNDSEKASQYRQALAVVRIVNAVGELNRGMQLFPVEAILEICYGCAQRILAENGAGDYPHNLPEDHHPLAQDTLKLAMVDRETIQCISTGPYFRHFELSPGSTARAIAVAATKALAQAHWKLYPPIRPSTSRISPTR